MGTRPLEHSKAPSSQAYPTWVYLEIPDGANVYYALATVPEQITLLLNMKTDSSNR